MYAIRSYYDIAGILYMDRHAPAGAKTMGQAVNNASLYGLGMLIGVITSYSIHYTKLYEDSGHLNIPGFFRECRNTVSALRMISGYSAMVNASRNPLALRDCSYFWA